MADTEATHRLVPGTSVNDERITMSVCSPERELRETCQRKSPCAHAQGYESHRLRSRIFDGVHSDGTASERQARRPAATRSVTISDNQWLKD